jgi:hypothetical protein
VHELCKAGATVAANKGASAPQLMVIFGWDTIKQDRAMHAQSGSNKLAEAAMHLLEKR